MQGVWDYCQDLMEFCRAVWASVISRVTGGLLAAFLTILAFYPPAHPPPAGILWGAVSIYFFLSAFGAWRKEHLALQSQIKKPPTIDDEFEEIRRKFDDLETWAQQLLECVFVIGHTPENATSYRSHGTSGPEIDVPRPNPLAELNKATGGWLIREGAGYSITVKIRRHCPGLWQPRSKN